VSNRMTSSAIQSRVRSGVVRGLGHKPISGAVWKPISVPLRDEWKMRAKIERQRARCKMTPDDKRRWSFECQDQFDFQEGDLIDRIESRLTQVV
jgi:hypothetical protein